eukprot:SAG11_NODE_18757_length_482_cov_0.783290_1_plen_37_part_10
MRELPFQQLDPLADESPECPDQLATFVPPFLTTILHC